MVRLNVPKSQKKRNVMSMSNQLNSITHFGDITALTGGEGRQVGSDDIINSQLLIMADTKNKLRLNTLPLFILLFRMRITHDRRKRRNS